jgi:hypothetical protein
MLLFVLFAMEDSWINALLSLVSGVFILGFCLPFVLDAWRDSKVFGLLGLTIMVCLAACGLWLALPVALGVFAVAILVAIAYAGWRLAMRLVG